MSHFSIPLLALILAQGAAGQVPGPEARKARASAAIESLGGEVRSEVDPEGHPFVSVMLISSLAKDNDLKLLKEFDDLRELDLSYSRITDAGLAHLAPLVDLRVLRLDGTRVTDAGLVHLKGLSKLLELTLNYQYWIGEPAKESEPAAGRGDLPPANPPGSGVGGDAPEGGPTITDAGLAHLEGLPLERLGIEHARISKVGLEHVAALGGLRGLGLWGATVTDAGLEPLGRLARLDCLDLAFTKITDAGLVHLQRLRRLESLSLCGTKITDDGLAHLEGMTSLEGLDLSSTKITNVGLLHLRGLSRLEALRIHRTLVTSFGTDRLKKSLPAIDIR